MIRKLVVISCISVLGILPTGCGPSPEKRAIQTAIAATATFEALPTPTPTQTPPPTLTPTKTLISTPTPEVNANNLKTEASTVGPMENPYKIEDYLAKYLVPADKAGTVRGRNITEWTPKERQALKINGPGVYTISCDPTDFLDYVKDTDQYVAAVIPLPNADDPCAYASQTLSEIKDRINNFYPELKNEKTPEKFNRILADYLSMSADFQTYLSNGSFVVDAFNSVEITLVENTGAVIGLYRTFSEPNKKDFIQIIYRP